MNTLKNILNSDIFKLIIEIFIIYILILFVNQYLISPFRINGSSMDTTYYDSEHILIEKVTDIKRGDVIVFKSQKGEFYIKRLIGLPGDKLNIGNGKVYVNGIELSEPYLNDSNRGLTFTSFGSGDVEFSLKENDYFVIGDNRIKSSDSRQCFGDCKRYSPFIKKEDILGKVFLDLGYFNLSNFSFKNDKGENSFPKFFSTYKSHNYTELN